MELVEVMREGEMLKREWKEKELQFPRTTSTRPHNVQDKIDVDESPAMKMIEEIIVHPDNITLGVRRTSKSGKRRGRDEYFGV